MKTGYSLGRETIGVGMVKSVSWSSTYSMPRIWLSRSGLGSSVKKSYGLFLHHGEDMNIC